jgi:hypothetical protein
MRIRPRNYEHEYASGSSSTSEGVLGCEGSQVSLRLRDGSTLVGEVVRAPHQADGVVTLTLRPWGVLHVVDVPRTDIARAAVAHARWDEHHRISCEQARRLRP